MPDLSFQITGVEPAARGLTPLLHFNLAVANAPPNEVIHSVILQAQIQILSPHRSYTESEKERLSDLFGTPDRWGQTLRNRLWTQTNTTVRQFSGNTEAVLPVQCTYDLNVTATKYFDALEEGDVPLLFLFSGTVFYAASDGRLQVQQIPWDTECTYRLPVRVWREMMDHHYPNSAWLYLHRDVLDRLHAYKRRHGIPTWEQTIERLLPVEEPEPAGVPACAVER
ncbi:DUF6084 family protein [Verrucomicrobiota bacterium sgz303538]